MALRAPNEGPASTVGCTAVSVRETHFGMLGTKMALLRAEPYSCASKQRGGYCWAFEPFEAISGSISDALQPLGCS